MSDLTLIYNGNWTEWSEIWAEITRVISKSQVRFQTKIARHELQLPLYNIHFEIAQIQDLVNSNILLMQYWAGLKFDSSIHLGGGGGITVLETKVAKFATILFFFHFPAIWLFSLKKPWNLIGSVVFSVAFSLAGKKMRFKAKNGAIRE